MKNLKDTLKGLRKNIPLKDYTTFRIGGPARYFFAAKTKEDLIKAIKWARKNKLPFFILGGGGNVLAADEGFEGLVIKIKNEKLKIKNENEKLKIICEAGVPLANLVSKSLQISATGLDWAIGIPGTVGGAIAGNAGAFGKSMADVIKSVEVLEISDRETQNSKFPEAPPPFRKKEGAYGAGKTPAKGEARQRRQNHNLKLKTLKNKDCRFGYRDSIFKQNRNLIIISAEIELKKGNKEKIQKKMKEYLIRRVKNQPLDFPSAGSVFKNPPGFSAGELIEKCGLKGKKIGQAIISEKHANFIVNLGGAKAKDVLELIEVVKKEVEKKFGLKLEEEIQYLGFSDR